MRNITYERCIEVFCLPVLVNYFWRFFNLFYAENFDFHASIFEIFDFHGFSTAVLRALIYMLPAPHKT